MSYPVIEIIAQDILATVATVTVANGYNYDLTVQRHTRHGDKINHLNCIIIQEDPIEVLDTAVYNTREWQAVFAIAVFLIPETTDATPIDQYVNLACADIEKALMIDRYRSANALDTTILPHHRVVNQKLEYDLLVVNVETNYRTSELNPYVNAR